MEGKSESIKVAVRCRPFSKREKESGSKAVLQVQSKQKQIVITNTEGDSDEKIFTFDSVFDPDIKQNDVFEDTAKPILDSVLQGFNGTIFCYGQTGTGKTHTMQGDLTNPEQFGIIPRCFDYIFNHIQNQKNRQYLLNVSYLEIYNEEIRDLLSSTKKQPLEMKERPDLACFQVKDLLKLTCHSKDEMEKWMTIGNRNRSIGMTLMNAESSRSHSIFTITIESQSIDKQDENSDHLIAGKLHLVDLAGSERQSKTQTSGIRFKEATKINLSLSALSNVISALSSITSSTPSSAKHVPYRDSKLTKLLMDSLGGNSKTLMIATISPASDNFSETLSTLRWASRAKKIKNKPKVNEDPKDAVLREYREEVERLTLLLQQKQQKKRPGTSMAEKINETNDTERLLLEKELQQKDAALQNEKTQREKLEQQIQEIQQKLIIGGLPAQYNSQQDLQVQSSLLNIKEEKKKKEKVKDEKNQKLEEEVNHLQKKLKKLKQKIASAKQESQNIQQTFYSEKQEILDTIQDLNKELRLKGEILNTFIPERFQKRIWEKFVFDEETHSWIMNDLKTLNDDLPNALGPFSRPMSYFARQIHFSNINEWSLEERVRYLDKDWHIPDIGEIIPMERKRIDISFLKGQQQKPASGGNVVKSQTIFPKARQLVTERRPYA